MNLEDISVGLLVNTSDGYTGIVAKIGESGMYRDEYWSIPDRICVDCTASMTNPPPGWYPIRWYFPRELEPKT